MRRVAKFAGPVKTSSPNPRSIALLPDRSLFASLLLGGFAGLLILFGWWIGSAIPFFPAGALALASFAVGLNRPYTIVSAETNTVERFRRSWLTWRWKSEFQIPFREIKEFLVQAEMEFAPDKPTAWHLFVLTEDGRDVPLTWHMERKPVWDAAEAASRVSGKPVRENDDPLCAKTWDKWGYMFLR